MSTCTAAMRQNFQNPIYSTFFSVVYCVICFFVLCAWQVIPLRVTPLKFFHKRLELLSYCIPMLWEVSINLSACIGNYQLSSSHCGYNFCNMFLCTYLYQISKFMLGTFTVLGTDILSMRPPKTIKIKNDCT